MPCGHHKTFPRTCTPSYTMQNKFSNCFLYVSDSPHQAFYGQIIASRYMRRSLEKEFPVKNQECSVAAFVPEWCQFLRPVDVKDIFYDF